MEALDPNLNAIRNKKWQKENPEKYKKSIENWRLNHPEYKEWVREYQRKYQTEYRKKHPDLIKQRKDSWYNRNKQKYIDDNYESKIIVYLHYSKNNIKCACCGEKEIQFLTVDHIDGLKKHGHDHSHKGIKLYRWLIQHNFPEGFQILCMNCNFAKGQHGICPHKKELLNLAN